MTAMPTPCLLWPTLLLLPPPATGKHIPNSSAQTPVPTSNATQNRTTASTALMMPVLAQPLMNLATTPTKMTTMTFTLTPPHLLSQNLLIPTPTAKITSSMEITTVTATTAIRIRHPPSKTNTLCRNFQQAEVEPESSKLLLDPLFTQVVPPPLNSDLTR